MNIVALCKTFAGEEWLEAMVDSVAPHVSKIVFVNSNTSWTGRIGNTCDELVSDLMESSIYGKQIDRIYCDTIDQDEQCMAGYQHIKDNYPDTDYVMLIDTDEIWDNDNMKAAIQFLKDNPGHDAYRTSIYTYINSPLWRVSPIEPLQPVCFVRPDLSDLGQDARACGLKYKLMQRPNGNPILYHHFVYVRKDFNTILEKIVSSHVSEQDRYVDMSDWIPEVWNNLPVLQGKWKERGFHPHFKWGGNWRDIVEIKRQDLPEVLQTKDYDILVQHGVV